jgi:hypothetical protein
MNFNDCGPNLENTDICIEGLKKTKQRLRQYRWSSGWCLNQGPRQLYSTGVNHTTVTCQMKSHKGEYEI